VYPPLLVEVPSAAFSGGAAQPSVVEAFSALKASLTYFNVDRPLNSVLVTSAVRGDGKTTVATNLALGLYIIASLRPDGWIGWDVALTACLCCFVAGFLTAAGWSRSYWGGVMTRQVGAWRQIVDAIFVWLDDLPVSADAMLKLKRSVDDAIVGGNDG